MVQQAEGAFKWEENPFSFKILPDLFVGYSNEVDEIMRGITNGDKFILLTGPTGSGKTTLLRHISSKFPDHTLIYLPKPPKNPEDWVSIFHPIIRQGLFSRLFRKDSGVTIYNLSERVSKKLESGKCILLVDECHESTQESLEWVRTITDQVEHLTIVLAGLPVFENILKDTLETLLRRITVRVDLGCLSQAEMREFIKKRVESFGGEDIRPFTSNTLDYIHERTGGFPRDVLKVCSELYQKALKQGITTIDSAFLKETDIPQRISSDSLESLPEKQKLIIDTLASEGELTPTEIVKKIQATGEYKNHDNAIRSVNNLVRRLMSDGLVERKRLGKAYKYKIAPRYQTLLVKA